MQRYWFNWWTDMNRPPNIVSDVESEIPSCAGEVPLHVKKIDVWTGECEVKTKTFWQSVANVKKIEHIISNPEPKLSPKNDSNFVPDRADLKHLDPANRIRILNWREHFEPYPSRARPCQEHIPIWSWAKKKIFTCGGICFTTCHSREKSLPPPNSTLFSKTFCPPHVTNFKLFHLHVPSYVSLFIL